MRIRKSIADLTDSEAREFIKALLLIKVKVANPSAPQKEQITVYDRFVSLHGAVMSVQTPRSQDVNMGHWYPGFLPWHREYLIRIERELNEVAPDGVEIAIPYWPWSDPEATVDHMLHANRFGNTAPGSNYGPVTEGYFAEKAPTGRDRPSWWPIGEEGWRVRDELQLENVDSNYKNSIYRQVRPTDYLPDTTKNIKFGLKLENYHWFWRWLEEGSRTHNSMHNWIGGTLSNAIFSPMDPIFLLNHANVDRLWALWQDNGHMGKEHYPAEEDWVDQPPPAAGEPSRRPIPHGHKLEDPMWPWVGDASGYMTNMSAILGLPNLATWVGDYSGESERRPIDVLDTVNMGKPEEAYIYQEAVVRFHSVQKAFNSVIERWELEHRREPEFSGHGQNFGWQDVEQIRNSRPKGQQLIANDLIGVGRADETNLIKILKAGIPGFGPRMPKGGPYLSSSEIQLITKWIDDGCKA